MNKKAKKYISLIVRILIAVGLMFYLFSNIDCTQFINQVKNADLTLFMIGLSLYSIISVLAILRWKLLLEVHHIKPPFTKLTKLFFVGLFFNNAMPGLTGGDIIKGYYIAKETDHHKPEAVTTVFIDRIIGIIGLLTIGLIALTFNLNNPELKKVSTLIICIFIALLIFTPIFLSKRLMKKIPFLHKLLDMMPFKETMVRVYHTFYKYKSHRRTVLSGLILSMLLQGISIIIVSIMGKAISLENVHLSHYFLFIPIISTISALPISISGLGVNENLYVYCFGLVGASEEGAVAIALMSRLVLIIWSLPGWFFYMTMSGKKTSDETMAEEIKEWEKQI